MNNAILCAEKGWGVFTLWSIKNGKCTCGNSTCGNPGKHPIQSGGFKNATTDIADIELYPQLFGKNINIGLRAGQESNVVVLDIDRKSGGIKTLQDLIQKHGKLPDTVRVNTGGGGYHVYFKYPANATIKNSTSKVGGGLDIRGDGGYVIIPESSHISGRSYTWDISPNGIELANMPQWLIDAATKTHTSTKTSTTSTPQPPEKIISTGQRNSFMTSEAGKLRRISKSKDEILASLIITNQRCSPPLSDQELELIIESVCKYAINDLIHYELTEVGDLQRFTDHLCEALSIIKTVHTKRKDDGEWYHFNNNIWRPLTDNMILNLYYIPLFMDIQDQVGTIADGDIKKHYENHVKRMKNLRYISTIIDKSKGHPLFQKPDIVFDKQPYLVACKNGIIDLTTGELRNGKPSDYLTVESDIIYDMTAECPRWIEFLDEIFEGDEELIHYIQKAIGYTLTGENKEECFFLMIGKGRNGKSKFIEAIRKIMGNYHNNLRFSSLEIQKNDKIRNDLAKLYNARIVSVSEGRDDRDIDESLFKDMTGGDEITCRFLREEDFSFIPQFALWMFSNKLPKVNEGSEAFYERARIINFGKQFLGDDADKNLSKKLEKELSGILNWAVQGCLMWQREGLTAPKSVKVATQEFKEINRSPYELFADTLEQGGLTTPQDLWFAWKNWCNVNGEDYKNQTIFGTKIKAFVEYSKTKRKYTVTLTQQNKSDKIMNIISRVNNR